MRSKVIFTTALLSSLALAGPALAGDKLDNYCLSFINPETTVALCDPVRQTSGLVRIAGQTRLTDHSATAVIDRDHALGGGERVEAVWRDASPEAVLYVSGAGRSAVFPLFSLGSKASVSLRPGRVILARGSRATLPNLPETGQVDSFVAPTPAAAVAQIRAALADLRRRQSLGALCRSLDNLSRRFYLYFYGLPDQFGCVGALQVFFLGSEAPSGRVRPSQSQLIDINRVDNKTAYARLSLNHRFAPDGDNRQAIQSQALIMLRRDRDGNWRLTNPQSLMPLNVYRFRSSPPAQTPGQARREWRQLVRRGAFWQRDYFARQLGFAEPSNF